MWVAGSEGLRHTLVIGCSSPIPVSKSTTVVLDNGDKNMKRLVAVSAIALAGVGAALSSAAQAQTMQAAGEKWEFQAILYAYLPSIGGNTAFSGPGGNSSVYVSVDKKSLDNLNFTFMGTFEARKGRSGVSTDLLYLDVNGSKSNSRDFTIGRPTRFPRPQPRTSTSESRARCGRSRASTSPCRIRLVPSTSSPGRACST